MNHGGIKYTSMNERIDNFLVDNFLKVENSLFPKHAIPKQTLSYINKSAKRTYRSLSVYFYEKKSHIRINV